MAEAMLGLAAAGVDVLRLDAVPFLWKRLGTNCQNQPEVHELLQALPRGAADRRAGAWRSRRRRSSRRATSCATSATGRHEGKECDLAYHNVLMVLLLERAGLGRGGAADAARCRRCRRVPPGAGWVTYVRCHDDIGWAITRRGRRRARARTRTCTGGSWPTSTRASSRARSRAARASSPTRAPARRARAAPAASLAGLECGAGAGDARGGGARDPARPAAARARVRPRRAAADLHGRRAGAAQRPRVGRRPRARRRQPLDAPAADGLGGGRAPARPGHGARGGCGRACGGCRGAPGDARRARAGPRRAAVDGQRPRLRRCCASTPASACCCSPTSRRPSRPCTPAWRASAGFALHRGRAVPDGRPLARDGDFLVLAPYQHLWLHG